MECFIIEKGVEKKAGLEEILPLYGIGLQHILRDASGRGFLPYAVAYLPDEMKKHVYSHLLLRNRGRLEKKVEEVESRCSKDDSLIQDAKTDFISFIGKNYNLPCWYSGNVLWKEIKPKEPDGPVEEFINDIEEACVSGRLFLSTSDTNKMSEEEIQNAFMTFKNRKDELKKIRSLNIYAENLHNAGLLFEAGGIDALLINGEFDGQWPEFLQNCQSLTSIELNVREGINELPSWIRNAVSLRCLSIRQSNIALLPDWIGDIQSLTELDISYGNNNLKTLPDSVCNLKNLAKLSVRGPALEKPPYSIGDLSSLKELYLNDNKNLTSLPDSIGNLKNLTALYLCGSDIEKLPETITDCSSLECLDIRKTNIASFPDSISSIKEVKKTIEVIPKKRGISYISFCNYYYTLVETIFLFSGKARREGLLSLEDEMDSITDGFFLEGIRLVLDAVDEAVIRELLAFKVEREQDNYIKKLKKAAMEGILCILNGDSFSQIGLKLAAMVNIKNNPLDGACAKYLAGDNGAFYNIDFKSALRPQEEREEIRFIKRAFMISETERREGIVGIEQNLDNDGIAARDVFEYGLSLALVCPDYKEIDTNLTMLIAHETDPALKNFSLAKKEAVRMIYDGYNPRILMLKLAAYFDNDVAEALK